MFFEERRRRSRVQRKALLALRTYARSISPEVEASASGTIRDGPGLLTIRMKTRTDTDRHRLADPAVARRLREILLEAGVSPSVARKVSFVFLSQETIDREWSRDWRHTMS